MQLRDERIGAKAPFRSMLLALAVAVLSALALAVGDPVGAAERTTAATAPKADSALRRKRLGAVTSWGYQLRLIEPDEIAASPYDLVVVDHAISANRRFVREFTPEEVARMKSRPDGSRRIVLAYLSIGEAERYRFYWQQEWFDQTRAPPWLSAMNSRWDGNYHVRFWDPGWQAVVFGGGDTYLARIKAQGFDGIYLDRADIYAELERERPTARADMIRFIRDLAEAARKDDPAFNVVMQNAEELVQDAGLRRAIDGIAKEDLFFGVEHTEKPNPPAMVSGSLDDLRLAKRGGLAVLAVEYLDDPARIAEAVRRTAREGFVLHIAERSLGSLRQPPRP